VHEFEPLPQGIDLPKLLRCKREHGDDVERNLGKAGHRVGAAWCANPHGDRAVVVAPKFDHLQPVDLLQVAELEVWRHESRNPKDPVFALDTSARPVVLPAKEAKPFLLFFVARYLQLIHPLLPRMRKREYRYCGENLGQKVRGRVLVGKHLRLNLAQGRSDRVFCEFPVYEEDNELNQLLKAGLECSRDILALIPDNPVADLPSKVVTSLRHLEPIRALHKPSPPQVNRARRSACGFFASYRPALELALVLLKMRGKAADLPNKSTKVTAKLETPAFAIDMEKLFELYVRALVLKAAKPHGWGVALDSGGAQIDAMPRQIYDGIPRLRGRQPDLLLAENNVIGPSRCVVEVKYRGNESQGSWLKQFMVDEQRTFLDDGDREQPRHGFFQTVAYMHLFGANRAMIVYPCPKKSEVWAGLLGFDETTNSNLTFLGVGPNLDHAKSVECAVDDLLGQGRPAKQPS